MLGSPPQGCSPWPVAAICSGYSHPRRQTPKTKSEMAQPEELIISPHTGVVALQWFGGRQCLVHRETGERCELDATPRQRWRLHIDTEGAGFVSNGMRSDWIDDLLKITICEKAGGREKYVVFNEPPHGTKKTMRLQHYAEDARPDLNIALKTPHSSISLVATHRRSLVAGSHCLWNLPHVFKTLCLETQRGDASRWTSHGWPAWAKIIELVGLPAHHLMKKSTRRLGDKSVGMALASSKTAEARMCSTHAFVALLSKWASDGKGGMRHPNDKSKVESLLAAVVEAPFGSNGQEELCMTIFLHGAEWNPPLCPTGQRPLRLVCRRGFVELRDLAAIADPAVRATMSLLRPLANDEGLVSLRLALPALAADCFNPRTGWLFKQLVWCVGHSADDFFDKQLRHIREAPLAKQPGTASNKGILKYWFGTLEAFRDPLCLHIALDGSTLLKRSVVAGIVALPEGTGAVFPPQVAVLGGRGEAYRGGTRAHTTGRARPILRVRGAHTTESDFRTTGGGPAVFRGNAAFLVRSTAVFGPYYGIPGLPRRPTRWGG